MSRVLHSVAVISVFTAPLAISGADLPEHFSFQRYAPMLNATVFGAPSQPQVAQPGIGLYIKSMSWDERGTVIVLSNGRVIETGRHDVGVDEDGLIYPVLPPKRPKQ